MAEIKKFHTSDEVSSGPEPAKETQEPEKLHKTSHTVAAFIILLIFCALVGGGTWWYLKSTQGAAIQSNLTWKAVAGEETKDWKTYKNEKNKYSIKYPKDWVYKDYSLKPEGSDSVGFAENQSKLAPEQSDGSSTVGISVSDTATNEATVSQHPDKVKKETITIGKDISATKYTLLPGRTNDMGGEVKYVFVEVKLAGGKYAIIGNTNDVQVEIFEKMLKTFKLEK